MRIKIKYFGLIAEAVGKGEEQIEVPNACTIEELERVLKEQQPVLLNKQFKVAINHSIIHQQGVELKATDELALLPPFAGG